MNKEIVLGAYDNVVPSLHISNKNVKCIYVVATANVEE